MTTTRWAWPPGCRYSTWNAPVSQWQPMSSQSVCLGRGRTATGEPSYAARVVTLHGPEFLNLTPVAPGPNAIRDLEPLE